MKVLLDTLTFQLRGSSARLFGNLRADCAAFTTILHRMVIAFWKHYCAPHEATSREDSIN